MSEKKEKLTVLLGGYLALNPQNEAAHQNLQKLIDILPDKLADEIYEMAKTDIVARGNRQISAIKQEMERL